MEPPLQRAAYRVLARAYRPTRLSALIGQEALVRTLTNAFATGRVAHAFLLSGIRGVGKTTTARIIARGLNCTGPDGSGGPTPEPCGQCPSCVAIDEGRALDVIEMDAASQTGKEDVLDLLEGLQFLPSQARYKVYILDEVHMLSAKAWNALLKTVEEPPPHAKFVFATTEVRKVPVTVLSRCQRFELRRVEPAALVAHLRGICTAEGVAVSDAALGMLARAAEGSVRDALSLLDQAIATAEGEVDAPLVQAMLGQSDRLHLLELFATLMRGDAADALARFGALYAEGADPLTLAQDLLETSHALARLKVAPDAAAEVGIDPAAAERAAAMARELSLPVLARAWQMLLRGIDEIRLAPDARAAAEMMLLRIACVSDLPSPAELARLVEPATAPTAGAPRRAAPAPRAAGARSARPEHVRRAGRLPARRRRGAAGGVAARERPSHPVRARPARAASGCRCAGRAGRPAGRGGSQGSRPPVDRRARLGRRRADPGRAGRGGEARPSRGPGPRPGAAGGAGRVSRRLLDRRAPAGAPS